jgi:hypothetical protein
MSVSHFRARVGLMTLMMAAGVAAGAAPPQPPTLPLPSAQVRVTLDVIQGFSSRLLCLTPSARGELMLPAAAVPRRLCLSAHDWRIRHVRFADE